MRTLQIAAVLAASLASAPHLAAQAEFIPIGDLPGDNFNSSVNGISGDGEIAVGASRGTGGLYAIRWTEATGMEVLPSLSGGPENSRGLDISANGKVIVGTSKNEEGERAVRWTSNGLEELGEPKPGLLYSFATDVSADGSTIVGTYTTQDGTEGFVWTEATGLIVIGDLPGGNVSCIPACVSADGTWVGGRAYGAMGNEAFLWSAATGFQTFSPLPTGEQPFDISHLNFDGSKAYGSALLGGNLVAIEWNQGQGVALLPPPPISTYANASVSDLDGSIVAINSTFTGGSANPYLLFPSTGQLVQIEDYLLSQGVPTLGGRSLNAIRDVSLDGKTVIGGSVNLDGKYEGWVARLEPTGPAPIGNNYCGVQTPNSTGSIAQIGATGFQTAAVNSVTLLASQLPPAEFGFFLNSMSSAFVPMAGGSLGNLCLGGMIGRYNADVFGSQAGATSLILDLGRTPSGSGFVAITAGQTWYFQAWFRDTAAGSGASNFTDGLEIAFQ